MSPYNWQFEAIGTKWEVQVATRLSPKKWASVQQQIIDRIAEFDASYSRFRTDSWVTKISEQTATYQLPADAFPLLQLYEQLYKASNGAVTPLIGKTMVAAGYDAAYSLTAGKLEQPPTWESVLSYDQHQIGLRQPMLLDFGAAGKGYLVDIVSELLEAAEISDYLVNAGGDIRQRSTVQQPVKIGLENPREASEAIGIVELVNQSLCASAGSKRAWGEFTHIIDPHSLQSPEHILATWVMAADTMTADGVATALFFTPAADLRQSFHFSYALLRDDMSLEHDAAFPVKTFTEETA